MWCVQNRKITYPTIVPMEDVTQYRGRTVNGCKIKEMIYNKVNESEGNEEWENQVKLLSMETH